jgi:annexin A7/11
VPSPQPPVAPYGAPGGYGAPVPQVIAAPPSPGYIPNALPPTDMNGPAVELRDSMKGFGTNEPKLIQTLAAVPDAPHMLKLRHTYDDRFRRSLLTDIEKETSGWFRTGLLALCRGPLLEDACVVDRAIRGMGTKESMLNDVLLGRSNADLNAIKTCYATVFHKDMAKEIREDLSMKTERLFDYVLEARKAEESASVLPHDVEAHVDRLQQATEGTKFGTNQDVVSQIMAFSSNGMIRAIDARYKAKYRQTLDELIKHNFSGHMRDALRLIATRAVDPVKADADQLEETMKGMGTKDELLVTRLVRAHWNREHFRQVKFAYQKFHGKDLVHRIQGETSGDEKRLLVALCQH